MKIWHQVANHLVCIFFGVDIVPVARAIVDMNTDEPNVITVFTNWAQVGLITLLIIVNIAIGIVQEGSAEEVAKALVNMFTPNACVVRDSFEGMIPATDVVPEYFVRDCLIGGFLCLKCVLAENGTRESLCEGYTRHNGKSM